MVLFVLCGFLVATFCLSPTRRPHFCCFVAFLSVTLSVLAALLGCLLLMLESLSVLRSFQNWFCLCFRPRPPSFPRLALLRRPTTSARMRCLVLSMRLQRAANNRTHNDNHFSRMQRAMAATTQKAKTKIKREVKRNNNANRAERAKAHQNNANLHEAGTDNSLLSLCLTNKAKDKRLQRQTHTRSVLRVLLALFLSHREEPRRLKQTAKNNNSNAHKLNLSRWLLICLSRQSQQLRLLQHEARWQTQTWTWLLQTHRMTKRGKQQQQHKNQGKNMCLRLI